MGKQQRRRSGILVEGVLESMTEYYSAELSQKIRRGMEINAQKRLNNGSNPGDEINRKGIVNIFLRAIYLWEDRFMLILNGGNKPVMIEDIPFEEIEASNAEFECSFLVADVPPRRSKLRYT